MYYVAKMLQAAALSIILIDFLRNFPELMSRTVLIVCIALFTCGWIINRYFVRK